MMMDRKFLHQGEDIKIIRQEIFILRLLVRSILHSGTGGIVQVSQFFLERELRDEMSILEIRPKVAVLGNIRKEL